MEITEKIEAIHAALTAVMPDTVNAVLSGLIKEGKCDEAAEKLVEWAREEGHEPHFLKVCEDLGLKAAQPSLGVVKLLRQVGEGEASRLEPTHESAFARYEAGGFTHHPCSMLSIVGRCK